MRHHAASNSFQPCVSGVRLLPAIIGYPFLPLCTSCCGYRVIGGESLSLRRRRRRRCCSKDDVSHTKVPFEFRLLFWRLRFLLLLLRRVFCEGRGGGEGGGNYVSGLSPPPPPPSPPFSPSLRNGSCREEERERERYRKGDPPTPPLLPSFSVIVLTSRTLRCDERKHTHTHDCFCLVPLPSCTVHSMQKREEEEGKQQGVVEGVRGMVPPVSWR